MVEPLDAVNVADSVADEKVGSDESVKEVKNKMAKSSDPVNTDLPVDVKTEADYSTDGDTLVVVELSDDAEMKTVEPPTEVKIAVANPIKKKKWKKRISKKQEFI